MHYIYKIINTVSQKVYIGQTNEPNLRWSQHKSNAKYNRGNQVITRAMTKHGVDIFKFIVIASCNEQDDADAIETDIIAQCDSMNAEKGYNVNPGGNTSPRTEEVRKKISEGRRGIPSARKGKTISEEHKLNISIASIGKDGTNKGKKFRNEWKNNISKSKIGKMLSKEHKNNLSKSHKGKLALNRKLTFEQAKQIRAEYSSDLFTQKELALKYCISQDCIFKIIKGRTYTK